MGSMKVITDWRYYCVDTHVHLTDLLFNNSRCLAGVSAMNHLDPAVIQEYSLVQQLYSLQDANMIRPIHCD